MRKLIAGNIMLGKPKLNADEILKAEYGYIADTVFQANEDRSRVTSFYFVTVGSLGSRHSQRHILHH